MIGPIAEGFERLDHHRSDLEAREVLLGSLRGFEDVHRAHARAVARGRAVELTRAESAYHAARAEAGDKAVARDEAVARCAALEQRLRTLGEQRVELEARRRALEGSEAYRAIQELDRAEADAAAALDRERAAADALGSRSAALVCVEGVPSTAALELLRGFASGGARLLAHADFDWAGLRIVGQLAATLGATPWRMSAGDYRAGFAASPAGPALGDARAASAAWDAELAPAMREGGRALLEEQVVAALLEDVGR